ncbi:MAG: glycoside hydrolase family 73 protein [Streptosporangiaceae bacterium]
MQSVRKPRWQQATALMSLSTCGAMTGFAFAHGTVADLTSPTSMPVHLLASSKPAQAEPTSDTALRSAIVKAATYYLRLARDKSPAQVQSLIWQNDSIGGADHGESCAAFASLVLEMGAQATGGASWVSGGGTYPWPLHGWADVRVELNPNSPNVVSIQQDAETHGRWHPLGDGYTPKPGDWVLFDGHVEVVTKYSGGVLDTIGGDSMPNLSVNAHRYSDPLAELGVLGFVNNGELVTTTSQSGPTVDAEQAHLGQTDIPGLMGGVLSPAGTARQAAPRAQHHSAAQQQAAGARAPRAATLGSAVIPGLQEPTGVVGASAQARTSANYGRNQTTTAHVPDTAAQQAFISAVAPGAVAAQRRYGIPAAVTIAQAIDESGWGQSELATADHNLFGIKGTGPAGTVVRPTEEYEDGSWVATTASFRVYHNVAESIADHSRLLATGESYQQAMDNRQAPDAFANDLTGVYATDPNYGSSLISIMRLYNLYRYDPTPSAAPAVVAATPPVTTQVAAVDHQAKVPGLEQVGLAFGGSAGLGTTAIAPTTQRVPGPRGAAQVSAARADRHRSGQTPAAAPGARTSATTAPGRVAVDASGRNGGRPDTQTRSRMAHVTTRGSGQGRGGTTLGSTPDGRSGRGGTTLGGTPGGRNGRGGTTGGGAVLGGARIPGLTDDYPVMPVASASVGADSVRAVRMPTVASGSAHADAVRAVRIPAAASASASTDAVRAVRITAASSARTTGRTSGRTAERSSGRTAERSSGRIAERSSGRPSVRTGAKRYAPQIPSVVTTDFMTMAKHPLARSKPLYQDVASSLGVQWELLAACDWMQCKAQPQYSPVRGERLGSRNPDGTRFRTKSEALEQCAADLIVLADAVYQIDLTAPMFLSVLELAQVFAAFRWGGILRAHRVSAMEFPYSVEGLTVQHLDLRWPDISEPNAPDRPGARFKMPFGAVPVVLSLNYPAVA